MSLDHDDLTERLDVALDAVLTVRTALGGLAGLPMPDEALDVALSQHEGYQEAHRGFVGALEALRSAGATDYTFLAVEAAAHHLAGRAAEVGWMLGTIARGGLRTTEVPGQAGAQGLSGELGAS